MVTLFIVCAHIACVCVVRALMGGKHVFRIQQFVELFLA